MLAQVLDQQGKIGVAVVKAAIEVYSATGKSADSVRYEATGTTLKIFARGYIEAMETGRGPRQSSQDGNFKDSMLEYMKAKGIGADLTPKKREQLAKFLVLRINRDGDKLWQKGGGRDVYSSALDKFVDELMAAVSKDQLEAFQAKVSASLKGIE